MEITAHALANKCLNECFEVSKTIPFNSNEYWDMWIGISGAVQVLGKPDRVLFKEITESPME